jgi:hypothetical protein
MLLGEILIARGAVDPAGLARALDEQRLTRKRIGSLLIARGLADPDDVARALGEQHHVAAALTRHLAARDPELAALVAADYARRHVLLPIGRTRGGELIVCARDPRPELCDELEAMIDAVVLLAVAPADAIEPLVVEAYGLASELTGESVEIDVAFETGPTPRLDPEDLDGGMDRLTRGAFTLVELDDARVTKDHTQSGAIMVSGPRPMGSALKHTTIPPPVSQPQPAPPPQPTPRPTPPRGSHPLSDVIATVPAKSTPFDAVDAGWSSPTADAAAGIRVQLAALARAATRDAATDLVLDYVATRWTSALLFTVKEGAALGHRGHGVQPSNEAITAAVLPLTAPSSLAAAYDTKTLATEPPAGAATIQDRLERLLGDPSSLAVAPIVVGVRVVGLLAVGDCIIAPSRAIADLGALGDALGLAYTRILRDSKPR